MNKQPLHQLTGAPLGRPGYQVLPQQARPGTQRPADEAAIEMVAQPTPASTASAQRPAKKR